MTERMIANRIRKLKELEAQQKELEQQRVGDYIVRFTSVLTSRFDARRFQQEHSKLYGQYIRQTSSKRFSIA